MRKKSDIEERLRVIYGTDTRDLHVVEKAQSSSWLRLIVRVCVGLIATACLGVGAFFFYTTFFFSQNNASPLLLTVTLPTELQSGQATEIVVEYKNEHRRPVANTSIEVRLPPGFTVQSTIPEKSSDGAENRWDIGMMAKGESGKIVVKGVVVGEKDKDISVQAIATYRPSNFNADFTQIAQARSWIKGTIATMSVSGPSKAISGEEVAYDIMLPPTSTEAVLGPWRITLTLPAGFSPTKAVPDMSSDQPYVWDIPLLSSEQHITVTGVYNNDAADVAQFQANLYLQNGALPPLLQSQASALTNIEKNPLQVTLVGGGSSQQTDIGAGDTLRLSLQIENTSPTVMDDVSVLLDFQPENGIPIAWKEALLNDAKLTAEGLSMSREYIGTLEPKKQKIFHFSFPLQDTIRENNVQTFTVVGRVSAGSKEFSTPPLTVRVSGALSVFSGAAYFGEDGVALGSGPIPPRVGEETVYAVEWLIKPSIHDAKSVSVTATLPAGVSFGQSKESSCGTVSYEEITRTVRWSCDIVSVANGARALFSVRAIPEEVDVGSYMKLLSTTTVKALDNTTNALLSASADALTTETPNDPQASAVVEERL